jgi:hypothetical protein
MHPVTDAHNMIILTPAARHFMRADVLSTHPKLPI